MKISFDPIVDSLSQKLPADDLSHFVHLHEKAQVSPRLVRHDIEGLHFKYPDIPEIGNLYCFVLLQLREVNKAESLIRDTFKKHPEYLFAKINYADQCLRKKQPHKITEIFPKTFDLEKLYPGKTLFHYSECRGFWVMLAHYFLTISNRGKAEEYYAKAYKLDPAHPTVIALEKKLYPFAPLQKILKILQTASLFMKKKKISLRKNKHVFLQIAHLYKRKKKHLAALPKEELKQALVLWQQEILAKNFPRASELAEQTQQLARIHLKKSPFEKARDFTLAILVALVFAVLIRTIGSSPMKFPVDPCDPHFESRIASLSPKPTLVLTYL